MIRSVENYRRWHNDVWIWNWVFLLDRTFWYVNAIEDQLLLCCLMVLLLWLLVFLGLNGSINLSILDNVIHVVITIRRNIFEWKAVSNKAHLFGGLISNCNFSIDCCKYCLIACSKD